MNLMHLSENIVAKSTNSENLACFQNRYDSVCNEMLFSSNLLFYEVDNHSKKLKLFPWYVLFMYGTQNTFLDWFARLKDLIEV